MTEVFTWNAPNWLIGDCDLSVFLFKWFDGQFDPRRFCKPHLLIFSILTGVNGNKRFSLKFVEDNLANHISFAWISSWKRWSTFHVCYVMINISYFPTKSLSHICHKIGNWFFSLLKIVFMVVVALNSIFSRTREICYMIIKIPDKTRIKKIQNWYKFLGWRLISSFKATFFVS